MPSLLLLGRQTPMLSTHLESLLACAFCAFPLLPFLTCVVLGFKLALARHVSWCPSLQSMYLALDVFCVEPQLGTYIVVVADRGEGNLTNQAYHEELDGHLKTPTMQSFQNGSRKKE